MTDNPLPPSPTATKLLVDWANDQDGWIRLIVEGILASRETLDEPTLDAIYKAYRLEKCDVNGSLQHFGKFL